MLLCQCLWLQSHRIAQATISAEKTRLLRELGDAFLPVDRWVEGFRHLLAYRRSVPDRWPARSGADAGEIRLALWLAIQRHRRNRRKLVPERERLLMKLGTVWYPRETRWIHFLQDLQAFRRIHRDRWPTSQSREEGEKRLGTWCEDQRKRFRDGNLIPRRKDLLNRIRFPWEIPGHPPKVAGKRLRGSGKSLKAVGATGSSAGPRKPRGSPPGR